MTDQPNPTPPQDPTPPVDETGKNDVPVAGGGDAPQPGNDNKTDAPETIDMDPEDVEIALRLAQLMERNNAAPAEEEKEEDIFAGLDAPAASETVDSVKAECASIQKQIKNTQATLATLTANAARVNERLAAAEADYAALDAAHAAEKKKLQADFAKDLSAVAKTAAEDLSALMSGDAAKADSKFTSLATGLEKIIQQLTGVFNKYSPKTDTVTQSVTVTAEVSISVTTVAPSAADEALPETLDALTDLRSRLSAEVAALSDDITKVQLGSARARRDASDLAKRAEVRKKELDADKNMAVVPVVQDVFTPLDNLDRGLKALKNLREDAMYDSLARQTESLRDKIVEKFNAVGVQVINPVGEILDPHKHEGIAAVAVEGKAPGTIIDVAVKGYELVTGTGETAQTRMLRYAKVVSVPEPD